MKIIETDVVLGCSISRPIILKKGIKHRAILIRVLLIGLALAVALLDPMSVQAQSTYYVRAGATGSQNGSDWSNAYSSLPATLVRGATYYIADGSYPGRTFNTATSGTTLVTIKKAVATEHGTNTGWQSSYGDGQAIFTSGIDFESSYWIFDGVTGGGPGSWSTGYGFKIIETGDTNAVIKTGWSANVSYVTIKHVECQGKGSVSTSGGSYSNDGIAINSNGWTYTPTNITVSYVWMHGIGRCPIFFLTTGSDHLFEYLYISSYFASDAVHSEVMSTNSVSGDVTFRYSLVTDIQGTGGLMWDNSSNHNAYLYVYGNVFYKPAGATWPLYNGVIGGWTGGNKEDCYGLRIYNNAFVNITVGGGSNQPIFGTLMQDSGDNIAYNNLFYNSTSISYSKISTHDYNHYINSGGTYSEAHGTSASSGDPFVDYVNLDFRLKAPTAAGTSLPSPFNVDPLKKARGEDGTWDRGAYEFGGDSSLSTPGGLRVIGQ